MARRLPTPPLLAALVLLALVLWLVLGDLQRFQSDAPDAGDATTPTLTRVEYQTLEATRYQPQRTVQGQLEALREVELRSRYGGRVTARPVVQGSMVEAGTVLLALSRDALEAQLERAEDQLELARSELAGASGLRQRNRSEERR